MTIKVEREALLRVLSRAPSFHKHPCWNDDASSPIAATEDEFVLVELPSPPCSFSDDNLVEKLRSAYSDDECTVTSISSSSSSEVDDRRVTFADPLVTEEWTRPWTRPEDREKLFYSIEETQRFRQEYRLERKLLADLDVGYDNLPVNEDDLSNFLATSSNSKSCRHRISRVVVLHNDKFETFFHPDAIGAVSQQELPPMSDDFFDNDSFWSGSITWY